ncbi:MAG: protein TolQ [Bdellovibrionales bacterium]|nr:protein TolQ [Bdellovibrionales bacterium]
MQSNVPHTDSLGLVDLVMSAGLMGKLVMLLLLGISIFCWAIIFAKYRTLKTAQAENGKFLGFFWQSKSMDEIFQRVDQFARSPVAAVFRSGMKELRKLPNSADPATASLEVENVARSLSRTANDEVALLEKHVTWLATTASAAPFIGLFGTVWGIMTSFQRIGASGAANLAVVAPGISEALIATAAGIGAAIPAAVFYNYFLNQIKRVALDIDGFNQDFLNIVRRSQILARGGAPREG